MQPFPLAPLICTFTSPFLAIVISISSFAML
jgi:hypothetical protein